MVGEVLAATQTAGTVLKARLAKFGGSAASALTTILTGLYLADGTFRIGMTGPGTNTGGILMLTGIGVISISMILLGILSMGAKAIFRWVAPFGLLMLGLPMMFLALLPGFPVLSLVGIVIGGLMSVGGVVLVLVPSVGRAGSVIAIVTGIGGLGFSLAMGMTFILGGAILG